VSYFVTGATGFIGRHLVELLLERGGTVHALVRKGSLSRLDELRDGWGVDDDRVVAVVGDLGAPFLGVDEATTAALYGRVDHFFHLAALYDMAASSRQLEADNVGGTVHAVQLAHAVGARRFHHTSSIAAAGRYPGLFREDMFDEARGLRDPYSRSKHESEAVVRAERHLAWRVYRPGIVVGHSQTGEIDKVDGPYYFFKLLQKLGAALPSWLPLTGIEGGPLNLVPVDFVARAMDHIAHSDGLDGRTFHLVDPQPKSLGETANVFAQTAHAPRFVLRFDLDPRALVPSPVRALARGPLRAGAAALGWGLGIPPRILSQGNSVTHFDCSQTTEALEGTGIEVPPLEDYAQRLWKQWESNYDADLGHSRSLKRAVKGKRVLITGASSGIGRAAALKLGAAGAEVLLVARSADKLERVKSTVERAGGVAHVYPADLSDLAGSEVLGKEVIRQHGGVDVLVNNAGRSIRRSLALSQDRFHDFERTMQLNYFGSLKMILAFLPSMREQQRGHIINVSSIGVQANTPRFSAYVASKAALDAFSRSAAAELVDEGISISTVYMPLVKTDMIQPTTMYDSFSSITAAQAADLICDAVVRRPKRVSTPLGIWGELSYASSPKSVDRVLNTAYRLFPDSAAARGEERGSDAELSSLAAAFARVMRGVHW